MKTFYADCLNNWGDNFTAFLFRKLYGIELECCDIVGGDTSTAEMFGIGSIMNRVPRGFTGHIFGTGLMFPQGRYDLRSANVHALRGKRTRDRCKVPGPTVLGDPGLLAHLFAPKKIEKRHRYGIIPHYVDRENSEVVGWSRNEEALIIDIRCGVQNVINQAAACEMIVSSSLHGLVLADALDIPSQWVQLSDNVGGGEFKFVDYYSVYGEFPSPATLIDDAFSQAHTRDTSAVKAGIRAAADGLAAIIRKGKA